MTLDRDEGAAVKADVTAWSARRSRQREDATAARLLGDGRPLADALDRSIARRPCDRSR